eukprot:gene2377-2939_t
MKLQIFNPDGEEFAYEFKSEIPFSTHIKHLYYEGEISTHYSIQESHSGNWIESSNDPLIHQDNTLFFKLKPINQYVLNIEKILATTDLNNRKQQQASPQSPRNQQQQQSPRSPRNQHNPKNQIENQIQNQIQQYQKQLQQQNQVSAVTGHLIDASIEKLQVHLTLLMLEEDKKGNYYISSNIIDRIINIIFRYLSISSLGLLVFILSNNGQNDSSSSSTTTIHLNSLPTTTTTNSNNNNNNKSNSPSSQLPLPQLQQPNSTTPSTTNYKTRSDSIDSSNNNVVGSDQPISLFTLVENSIKISSNDFGINFYLFLLMVDQHQSSNVDSNCISSSTTTTNNSTQSPSSSNQTQITSEKLELIYLVFNLINNMYRLSPNPVNYINKLHSIGVFKRIIELKQLQQLQQNQLPKISNHPQYIVLRNNLMKELHLQRIKQINPDKIQHQLLLSDLWNSVLSQYPFGGTHSHHWLSLGFRGPNPIEDFRATGVLALRNLSYFAKNHLKPFQNLLLTQSKREEEIYLNDINAPVKTKPRSNSRSYPLAVIGISLTYTLANIFRIGRENSTSPQESSLWDIVFSGSNWFDECYVTTVNLFESLWHSEAHSYSDFPQVITHTRSIIEKVCSEKPKDAKDFKEKLNAILEKKDPNSLDFQVSSELLRRYHQLQPSHTNKRHIHKIFGERIDIDIVPPEDDEESNRNHQNNESDDHTQKDDDSQQSNGIKIKNNNTTTSNDLSDNHSSSSFGSITGKRLIKFFGERIDDQAHKSVQYAPQPPNVKSYKLKNFFGESTVVLKNEVESNDEHLDEEEEDHLDQLIEQHNQQQLLLQQQQQQQQHDGGSVSILTQPSTTTTATTSTSPTMERSHRLHVFFGEWFDTEQVEYSEKIRATAVTANQHNDNVSSVGSDHHSSSENGGHPSSPTMTSQPQPEHARLHKLNKFFGERVNIPISNKSSRSIGEGGGTGIFAIDDIDEEGNSNNSYYDPSQISQKSPEEARSDFKAQKLLGERLDIKKEKEAINFAPQPSHIREYKLHQLFGEMIPSSKVTAQQGGSVDKSWKKGNPTKSSDYHKSVFVPISTSLPSNSNLNININNNINNNNSNPTPAPSPAITISPSSPTATTTTTTTSSHQSPSQSNNTVNNNNNGSPSSPTTTKLLGISTHSLDGNPPSSMRESLNSEDLTPTTTTFDEDDDEDDLVTADEYKAKLQKSHRLHVFFGERFDVDDVGYCQRLSGTFGTPTHLSISPQPDTVKNFKLKKIFGKSPDTEPDTNSLSSSPRSLPPPLPSTSPNDNSGSIVSTAATTSDSSPKQSPKQTFSLSPKQKKPKSHHQQQQQPLLSSSLPSLPTFSPPQQLKNGQYKQMEDEEEGFSSPNTTEQAATNKLRREFKTQKLLGERIDVKKESQSVSFKDQPSTVKVDKLISLFGEKVAFSLKRKDSSPSLLGRSNSSGLLGRSNSNSTLLASPTSSSTSN